MNKTNNKLIFCAGTGRSGTHLVGRSIASNPKITGRIETPSTFRIITRIASRQDITPTYLNLLLKKILFFRFNKIIKTQKNDILEKSHPSIWLFEDIIDKINNVLFIGVYRDLEPTVNSMLNHPGVLSWYKKLPSNKVNRFLGINSHNVDFFHELPIEEKCAYRWLSHIKRLNYLKNNYPN